MKNIFLILGLISISTSFNACGGSSSVTREETTTVTENEEQFEKIPIVINCNTPATISEYMEVVKGDKIEEASQGSSIKLYHDENNLKKVCLVSGEALVVRVIK